MNSAALLVGMCVVAAATCVGCGSGASDGRSPATAPPADAGDLEPVDRDAAAAAAVELTVHGCGPRERRGAGTIIADHLVVTAAHVVAGATSVEVTDSTGATNTATVVMFDPEQDIAALTFDASPAPPVALRAEPASADEVGVIAVPSRGGSTAAADIIDVQVVRSVTIRTTDIYRDAEVERSGFEIEAQIDPGDSGAMVQLPGGGAGIVWARSTVHDDRAWVVRLPDSLADELERRALNDPVDSGPCA